MTARFVIGLFFVVGMGCGDEPVLPVPGLTAVSFNVHGSDTIEDPVTGPALATELVALEPDFVSLQECVSCEALLDLMPDTFSLIPGVETATALMFDSSRWESVEDGTIVLGSNDDGWGRRAVRWAEFSLIETGAALFVYSTHWCVSIRNEDDPCDVDKHIEYGQAMLDHVATHEAPSVIGGDFNVFDDFEDGPAIQFLEDHGWVDTLREVSAEPVVTYQGSNSFPPGRIDYVFATAPVEVTDAGVALESVSDHRPVSATMSFPAR